MSKNFAMVAFVLCLSSGAFADASADVDSASLFPAHVQEPHHAMPKPASEETNPFTPFTGKVKGRKVRLRATPDTDGRIVKELNRDDLLIILGERGDFYAVEPPQETKGYVFRSFVLDGIVEGNRVNVRLEPSLEAPVIAHLNSGDRIKGVLSSVNNKWYEITPPPTTRFFISKEYIDSIGGVEVKAHVDRRRFNAQQLLDAATLLTQAEIRKPFREMDIERIKDKYRMIIGDYAEFPDLVDSAKSSLATIQEEYTERRIAYLEERAESVAASSPLSYSGKLDALPSFTDRMKMWEPIETSLYLGWAAQNEDRAMDEFYDEQRQVAQVITGIVEPYTSLVKGKPGDFILRDKGLPVAYLYSTHVNLQDCVGKKVTVSAVSRSNNHFAFPAYFVLSVE